MIDVRLEDLWTLLADLPVDRPTTWLVCGACGKQFRQLVMGADGWGRCGACAGAERRVSTEIERMIDGSADDAGAVSAVGSG